jgi:NDP-sugar pyrophosphorylase family protein
MNVLIPLAGAGSRFINEGYKTPKPMIMIDNLPMVIKAAQNLPRGEKYLYLCRKSHLDKYDLQDTIHDFYPNARIISVNKLTEGQASTCLLAKNFINNNEELLIGACDNGMLFDPNKFNSIKQDCDCIIFTFRHCVTVKHKPEQYGWVVTDSDDSTVLKVSVKQPLSKNPELDHAIVGAFWFRKGSFFVEAAEDMINENRRINNEFYVDECINNIVQKKLRVKVFEIEKYICWGTPDDLRTYNYWKSFFTKKNV